MHQAAEDATNRDRRQNLWLIGLREKLENGKQSQCVKRIASETLRTDLDATQLQRVHRAPIPAPEEGLPPKPIIIRFLSFLEWVLATAREKYRNKEDIVWGGYKLSFFPDMTKETVKKRKRFKEVRMCRFTLAHPAELCFTWKGKRMKFTDYCEAMGFLNKHETEDRS